MYILAIKELRDQLLGPSCVQVCFLKLFCGKRKAVPPLHRGETALCVWLLGCA